MTGTTSATSRVEARCGAGATLANVSSKLFRSWRVILLAWAVLLAPQVMLVHALSHSLPNGAPHSGESDKKKQAPAKVCDSCLALAQLVAALPSSFDWQVLDVAPPVPARVTATDAPRHAGSAYDARAPPADLT